MPSAHTLQLLLFCENEKCIPHAMETNRLFFADADDESLRRYKASLLGAAATAVPKSEDPRQVF
jgi:hypothetical protein